MEEFLKNLNAFEERNNTSAMVLIHSDGSASIKEFWDSEELAGFKDVDSLNKYLKETQYKLSENGRCISPVQVVCNYCERTEVCGGVYPEGCFLENQLSMVIVTECNCDNPEVHTDANGINYCKKCKVEIELLKN